MKKIYLSIIIGLVLTGCLLSGGTHGSIKAYSYPVSKEQLQKAVESVIQNSGKIRRDYRAGYYNDTKRYITMTIKLPGEEFEYTFHYIGDSTYWAHSGSSELSISYIYDGKGNGGSEGNGKWGKTGSKVQKNMIKAFETDFINKVDSVLNLKHSED